MIRMQEGVTVTATATDKLYDASLAIPLVPGKTILTLKIQSLGGTALMRYSYGGCPLTYGDPWFPYSDYSAGSLTFHSTLANYTSINSNRYYGY